MNPSSIVKLDNFEKTKQFFNRDDVKIDENHRVRINPIKAKFPDGIPAPDIYVEARKVSDESGNVYFVFSNLMDAEIPSYIVPESMIVGAPELSMLPKSRTTEPAGSLNYRENVIRSMELSSVKRALETEEINRGKIGVYAIQIDSKKAVPGQFSIDLSASKAKRVIIDNIPHYIVDNEMDNYLRPDLVTSEFLSSEPQVIEFITPLEDALQARKIERAEKRAESEKRAKSLDERNFQFEKETRKNHISIIKTLNSIIGNHIDVPDALNKENRGNRIVGAFQIATVLSKITEFKERFGEKPMLGFKTQMAKDPKKGIISALNDLLNQIEKEAFLKENGFLVQVENVGDKININILNKDDIEIAGASFNKSDSLSKRVTFALQEDESIQEYIDILTMNLSDRGTANELGKPLEDEGKLESFWSFIACISLGEEWEDLPGLEAASYDGLDVYNIDEFSAIDLIRALSSDKETLSEISKEVVSVQEYIDSLSIDKDKSPNYSNVSGL